MSDHVFIVSFAAASYTFFAVFIATGIHLQRKVKRFLVYSLKAKGTIVSLENSVSMSSGMLYKVVNPVFAFKDAQGNEHRVRSSVGEDPNIHSIGDQIDVLYLPEAPQEATIDFKTLILMSRICWLAASISFVFATVILIFLS